MTARPPFRAFPELFLWIVIFILWFASDIPRAQRMKRQRSPLACVLRFVRVFRKFQNGIYNSVAAVIANVIFPCLNEAGALPWILGRMPEGFRPIVVDNGSTDGSALLAESLGATVVSEPRRGHGAAAHP